MTSPATRPTETPADRVQGSGGSIAVFLLDLDDFKEINDALGHDVGDEMLVAVARRLLAIVRPTDTVARLGGDEFVVVCEVKRGEEEMLRISDRIATALGGPYQIGGRSLIVSASIGGVFEPTTRRPTPRRCWPGPTTPCTASNGADAGLCLHRRRHPESLMPASEGDGSSGLRVALVCPYSLSRPGGVQGQVVGLARVLQARGHQVSVFAPLDDPGDAPGDIDLVVTGHSVSLPANGSVAPVSVSPRAAQRALRQLRAGHFDVVHVHEPFSPGLPYGLLVGRRRAADGRHLPPQRREHLLLLAPAPGEEVGSAAVRGSLRRVRGGAGDGPGRCGR